MMREFEEGGIAGREDILEAFAAFTVDLHKKGVLHLDYSAGNILFDRREGSVVF
jgi:serine/threonine protein kinase